ncbi:MAG: Na+/H+ antiporter subunit E, partial [Oscillospiraceae bacterium]
MFILMFLFWLALNGQVTVEIVLLGLGITAFIYWLMCKYFEYSPRFDILLFKNFFRIIQYILVLLWEIIKSSFAVIKMTFITKID